MSEPKENGPELSPFNKNLITAATSFGGAAALGLLATVLVPSSELLALAAGLAGSVGGFFANKLVKD